MGNIYRDVYRLLANFQFDWIVTTWKHSVLYHSTALCILANTEFKWKFNCYLYCILQLYWRNGPLNRILLKHWNYADTNEPPNGTAKSALSADLNYIAYDKVNIISNHYWPILILCCLWWMPIQKWTFCLGKHQQSNNFENHFRFNRSLLNQHCLRI